MAHFATIRKSDNVVVHVMPISNKVTYDENGVEHESRGIAFIEKTFAKGIPGIGPIEDFYFKQTSFNANLHGNTSEKKYNFAGIGHKYDPINNAFIAPKPDKEPLIDTSKMSELEKIALGSNLTLKGQWQLNQKMQWEFLEEAKIGSGGSKRMWSGIEQASEEEKIVIKDQLQIKNKNMIKEYFKNRDTITLLVVTAFFWTFLIAGMINFESVIGSLEKSLRDDGLFSFCFAGLGCLMVPAMSIVVPVLIIKGWIKFKK